MKKTTNSGRAQTHSCEKAYNGIHLTTDGFRLENSGNYNSPVVRVWNGKQEAFIPKDRCWFTLLQCYIDRIAENKKLKGCGKDLLSYLAGEVFRGVVLFPSYITPVFTDPDYYPKAIKQIRLAMKQAICDVLKLEFEGIRMEPEGRDEALVGELIDCAETMARGEDYFGDAFTMDLRICRKWEISVSQQ